MLLVVVVIVLVVLAVAVASIRRVPERTWYVVERSGVYRTSLAPGVHAIVPVLDRVVAHIDMDDQLLSLEEPLVTGDNQVVQAHIEIAYAVADPAAVYHAGSSAAPIEVAVSSALRQYAGSIDRDELTTRQGALAEIAREALGAAPESWGVRIDRVDVTDVVSTEG
ncbi:MAG: SPFH domain-containing protein [Nocardioides sp.]|nr:SPFH domain-containing protein [Nocardioides sp.]